MKRKDMIELKSTDLATSDGTKLTFFQGCKAAIPIGIGYIPIAIAFGLLAKSTGVPNQISIMMSLLIFAGASQFVGVNLLALGAGHWEIVLTTLILNLRHFLMTASVSQRIKEGTSKGWMAVLAFGVTDETFTVASLRPEKKLSPAFLLGLNLTSFSSWVSGTALGVFLGAGLPVAVQASMGIALYVMFIGLLVPSLGKSWIVLMAVLVAAGTHSILHWVPLFAGISTGWKIVLATVVASLVGAIFDVDVVEEVAG